MVQYTIITLSDNTNESEVTDMIVLKDKRTSDCHIEGLENIKEYLTTDVCDYSNCKDKFDIEDLLEEEQHGIAGYYIVEVEE